MRDHWNLNKIRIIYEENGNLCWTACSEDRVKSVIKDKNVLHIEDYIHGNFTKVHEIGEQWRKAA